MMDDWLIEFRIRRTLRRLARQRVAMVRGGIWIIEKAVMTSEVTACDLKTCHLRGWVEPIENALPYGSLPPDGRLPATGPVFDGVGPLYRLTEGGWAVVNREQQWVLISVALAVLALVLH